MADLHDRAAGEVVIDHFSEESEVYSSWAPEPRSAPTVADAVAIVAGQVPESSGA